MSENEREGGEGREREERLIHIGERERKREERYTDT